MRGGELTSADFSSSSGCEPLCSGVYELSALAVATHHNLGRGALADCLHSLSIWSYLNNINKCLQY